MDDALQQDEPGAARYHFIVPVWGAKYVEMFVEHSLPSQLSSGNIPSLPDGQTSYQIFTHAEDTNAIWQSSSVCKLRGMVDVSLVSFTDDEVNRAYGAWSDNPYNVNLKKMSWCYGQGIKSCRGVDTAFVFMTPDSVWGNGAFRYVHECQCSGVRAVVALGLITVRGVVQQRLEEFRSCHDGDVIEVSPRKLVKVACDALHPLGASRIVQQDGSRFSSAYYWTKPGKGLVARCFYLHPVMVRPLVDLERLPSTVDYRYVQLACPDRDRVRIVADSDDLFYIDMADVHHESGVLQLDNYSRTDLLDWMCQWTDDYHRAYFQQGIVLREGDGDEPFDCELAEAGTFADKLLKDFERYCPVSGKRLLLSNIFPQDGGGDVVVHQPGPRQAPGNLFPQDEGGEAADGPLGPRQTLLLCKALLRRATALLRSLPRRVVRRIYRALSGRLAARIQHLERQLHRIESEMQSLASYVRNTALGAKWKSNWIRTEYELRREISLLRADLEEAKMERVDPGSLRKTANSQFRLVGGSGSTSVRPAA